MRVRKSSISPHRSRSIPIGRELRVIVGKGSGRIRIRSGVGEWSGHCRKGFGTLSERSRVIIGIIHGYSDIDYTTYVDLTGPTRTRRNHDFKIRPRAARTNYFKFSFFNRYTNDWNSLRNSVMSASSLNSFKTLLLNYLFYLISKNN